MKKILFSVISAILITAMLLSFGGCNSASDELSEKKTEADFENTSENPTAKPSEKPSEKPSQTPEGSEEADLSKKTYNISKDSNNFKIFGRTSRVDGGITCDFTASGIEFSGTMTETVKLTLDCDRDTYFTVYIDGVRSEKRFFADSSKKELIIANFGSTVKEHNIRVLKQTEPQFSLCILKDLTVFGVLDEAPADKEYFIEFIGDSITCGYGNLGNNSTQNAGTALWEDGTSAYAFLSAEALNADCSIVGCSGIGIDKGFTNFSEKHFYPKTSYYRNNTDEGNYSFEKTPDLVVINLGTNDNNCGSTKEKFIANAKELIESVRSSYGTYIPIVWAYNMMGDCRADWMKQAVEELGGEKNDIYTVRLTQNNAGGNGHPTKEAQKAASEELVNFIRENFILV